MVKAKTKSTTKTKKSTTKKSTSKSKEIEIKPIKTPISELTPSQTGISANTEVIVEVSISGSKIIKVNAEQIEGKIIKTISQDQYFYPTDIIANTCSELLAIDLLKLSDNTKTKIEVAPEQLLFTKDETPIQAQDLLDGSVIKGVFSNFKVTAIHIFKNKYDRVYNFNNETRSVMLACGVLLNLGTKVDGTE